MEQLVPLLINLFTGAVGGNLFGALLKNFSLGTLGNTIAGVLGGGLGGQMLSGPLGSMLGSGMISDVAGSFVGGGGLMVIIGLIKSMMAK
ncbi:MAG: hypothetical protein AB8D52_11785 [Gammaproteobacteria bacterium]